MQNTVYNYNYNKIPEKNEDGIIISKKNLLILIELIKLIINKGLILIRMKKLFKNKEEKCSLKILVKLYL